MCLHYLGCDLSPTSSTSIMHHIHKQETDLGAPATHSYYFNWIKSEQISGTLLPHCGFSVLALIGFAHCIALRFVKQQTFLLHVHLMSFKVEWDYYVMASSKQNVLLVGSIKLKQTSTTREKGE